MKITNGIEMLEVFDKIMGRPQPLHPTVIWDNHEVILIDAGLPGQAQAIRKEAEKAGIPFDKLSSIIITHQDMDHIGSLSAIVNEFGDKVKVFAHENEKPYIDGEKRPIKMTPERVAQIEAQLNNLPEEKRAKAKALFSNLTVNVDRTLTDGEELPWAGGIIVIYTPGHTPGHICLYHKQSKTLITGDALNVVDGQLVGPNPQFTFDMGEAKKSLQKLTKYDIENVICYHGGIFNANAGQRLRELADEE